MQHKGSPAGIRIRHSRSCPTRTGGDCTAGRKGGCVPSFEASVWNRRKNEKVRKTFPTLAEAKGWRIDQLAAKRRGMLSAPTRKTPDQAWNEWYDAATAEPPTVRTRGGRPYKGSVLDSYRANMEKHVLPDLGAYRLSELGHWHLLDLADRLTAAGLSDSTIRNVVMPIRAVYRRERTRDRSLVNPTERLELPTGLGRRERVASVDEAEQLIGLLPESERALWATAFYAGLRLGELAALRWSDVDLATGRIHVRRAWDPRGGYGEPKSQKGIRRVPIPGALRDYLDALKAGTERDGDDLVFGSQRTRPFTSTNVRRKAKRAWATANKNRAEQGLAPLESIGLHELRHSAVTFMHEAGLSLEEIGDLVGHSSTYMSDRYRHLRDDRRDQLAARLDAYAALATTRGRLDQLAGEVGDRP